MTSKSIVSTHFFTAAGLPNGIQAGPSREVADQNLETDNAPGEDDPEQNIAAAVDAEIFGNGTIRGLAWVQEAIRSRANFAQRLPGTAQMTLGNGPGSMSNKTREEQQQDSDAEALEWFETHMDMAARQRERAEQIERQWDSQMHNFAGMDMSGEDIDALMDFIRDPKTRQALIERRAKEKNISTQQATKDVDNALRYGELFKKVEQGTATSEEIEEYHKLEADPNVIETWKRARAVKLDASETTSENDKASLVSSDQSDAVIAGANVLDVQFDSAPPIQEHFAEAKLATTPLDAKPELKREQVAAAPTTAPSPQVAASGFAV